MSNKDMDGNIQTIEKYLKEARRTIPVILVRPLIEKLRTYSYRDSTYLDTIIEIVTKIKIHRTRVGEVEKAINIIKEIITHYEIMNTKADLTEVINILEQSIILVDGQFTGGKE